MQPLVWILRFIIVVLLVWFAVKNGQEVELFGLPGQSWKAPLVFVLLTSFMTTDQAAGPKLWPSPFHPSNFVDVFSQAGLVRATINTVIYAGLSIQIVARHDHQIARGGLRAAE